MKVVCPREPLLMIQKLPVFCNGCRRLEENSKTNIADLKSRSERTFVLISNEYSIDYVPSLVTATVLSLSPDIRNHNL